MYFLVAFALKIHLLLKFLLETKIKPTSASGAVCTVKTFPIQLALDAPKKSSRKSSRIYWFSDMYKLLQVVIAADR